MPIDEVQYAPQLFSAIKVEVDRRQQKGLFWLTGPQQFHLMQNVSETLAGRVAILQLQGFSQAEEWHRPPLDLPFLPTRDNLQLRQRSTTARSLLDIYRRIWRGNFPALATAPEMDHDIFYNAYVQTYLQRDIRDLANVGDGRAFFRFMRSLAARTGQLLNLSDIGREVEKDAKTVKQWLSIVEAIGLVYVLEPYHSNATKRLVKTPKLHFLDTGLCCYLNRWTTPEALEAGAMSGPMLESYLFSEILKSYHDRRWIAL